MNTKFGPDDIPERFRMPGTVLYPRFEATCARLQQQALDQLATRVALESREDFLQSVNKQKILVKFKHKKLPFVIEGSDEIELESLSSSIINARSRGSWSILDGALFSNKSPYAFEEDISKYPDTDGFYYFYTSPEYPPFVVGHEELDEWEGDASELLAQMVRQGVRPRLLSQSEQLNLLSVLQQQEPDIEKMVREDPLPYL